MDNKNTFYSVTQIKDQNVYLVKTALRSVRSSTKQTIAQMTGLSVSTCNNILKELLDAGEVFLDDTSSSRVIGRPAITYTFNGNFKYVCCLNASWNETAKSTFFHYSIKNLVGEVIDEGDINHPEISYKDIENLLQQLVLKYPAIDTICFGTSGYYDNTKWSSARIFASLNGMDIRSDLESHLNRKVIVENDMNAIAFGIYNSSLHDLYNMSSMITVAFFNKKGNGAGIIYHGKIMHGYQNFAGEIGYSKINGRYIDDILDEGSDSIVKYASQVIENITTLLNPATCFLVGEYMDETIVDKIRTYNYGRIPANVMPNIVYLDHYHDYFTDGLYQIAIDYTLRNNHII